MIRSFGSRLALQVLAFLSLAGSTGGMVAFGYEADLNPGAEENNLLVSWTTWWFLLSVALTIGTTIAVYRAHERDVSAGRKRTSPR